MRVKAPSSLHTSRYPFIVQKFGGESVDETAKVWKMLEYQEGGRKVAVVSAFSKVTDQLFTVLKNKLGSVLVSEDFSEVIDRSLSRLKSENAVLSEATRGALFRIVHQTVEDLQSITDEVLREDVVIGLGERFSARIVAAHCNLLSKTEKYVAVDLSDLITTVDTSSPDWQSLLFSQVEKTLLSKIKPILDAGKVPVITGYMGRVPGGIMKLMDRGYSDSTLMLVARALASICSEEQRVRADICKTVMGVLSADPKAFNPKSPRARRGQRLDKKNIPRLQPILSKRTVARLAATGMKAVNAVAADLLEKAPKVDAVVRHTFHPDSALCTSIVDRLPATVSAGFKVIAHKTQNRLLVKNTSKLSQRGWISQILDLIATEGLSVNVVESPDNTCTILTDKDPAKVERIKSALEGLGNIADVTTVGWITCAEDGSRATGESNLDLSRAMTELYAHGINVLHVTAAPGGEISLMVSEQDMVHAVRYLHQSILKGN